LPDATMQSHSEYLRLLDQDLQRIREAAKAVQQQEQEKRRDHTVLNSYVVGDYVLYDEAAKGFRDQKLKTRYSGPYVVTSVHKADIMCKHMVTGKERTFHMANLKPFIGSAADAYVAAKTDDDQHVIIAILDYLGDPERRLTMKFLVQFEGNEDIWLDYNSDLADSKPFADYCQQHAELEPLTMTARDWKQKKREYNATGVVGVVPGDKCYVNLKAWGADYYQSIGLPTGIEYVVMCSYTKWTTARRKKIDLRCSLFRQSFDWDASTVHLYGRVSALQDKMVLVDGELLQRYPRIMDHEE